MSLPLAALILVTFLLQRLLLIGECNKLFTVSIYSGVADQAAR